MLTHQACSLERKYIHYIYSLPLDLDKQTMLQDFKQLDQKGLPTAPESKLMQRI